VNEAQKTLCLVAAVLILLVVSSAIVSVLRRRPESRIDPAILETFRFRVRAWWTLFATLAAAFLLGHWATVVLFGLLSFWALREFITVTPTRPGDHRTLFWVFFLITPLQFGLVGMGGYHTAAYPMRPEFYYGLYSILIPVYAFLLIPALIAIAGDYKRFLERTAKIQCGLLICVYCLSYAPALLSLEKGGNAQQRARAAAVDATTAAKEKNDETAPAVEIAEADSGSGPRLLFFFILISQLSDALQYAWSQLPNKHVIVPAINTTRTWEGLLGGTASVMLVGTLLWWATPFSGVNWWMSAVMSAVIALMGFAGSITMSAIKRDRGVKDYGTLIEGHGGVLDHIDSICFAAPVFFHFTRWWLNA
jgi:phosphatidate cytidylyltransferase